MPTIAQLSKKGIITLVIVYGIDERPYVAVGRNSRTRERPLDRLILILLTVSRFTLLEFCSAVHCRKTMFIILYNYSNYTLL